MKTETIRSTKVAWPKMNMRKWLSLKKEEGFDSDFSINVASERSERRKSCSDDGRNVVVPEELSEEWLTNDNYGRPIQEKVDLSMFVGTWNVGGNCPHKGLDVRNWLQTSSPADIYVIGFQEIVPLNAGNVLCPENKSPAAKWLSLIHQALNPSVDQNHQQSTLKPRASFSDLLSLENELGQQEFQRLFNTSAGGVDDPNAKRNPGFRLVESKQMVGIFLCVFVSKDLCHYVSDLKVSCVGRGIMGYLGNKGSISISMTLHRTTFCFVCTHLASGEKEGDEFKRNSDVIEILKKTKFSRSFRTLGKPVAPDNILGHEKIIWLGDLNYRLSSTSEDVGELLTRNDWQALLEKDQLKIEQKAGRIFEGWEEGRICFAPTYKYITNTDQYVAQTCTPKGKRRTPAWCDRILWKGEGLKQISYTRGESKFSDHRPVNSLFSVQVNLPSNENYTNKSKGPNPIRSSLLPACVAKVQAAELLLCKTNSCIESTPRFLEVAKKLMSH
ncbi:type I inositol polyphosphate 5-phosphatase 8 [Rutidosis leptorrhynchoides]|uniref:type I inositol polyphosphate 5-phosphatase 8 n=1 Tax=Rutidosis leptorrhynchoides TaxID=125765 RepID=UPI003A996BCA